MIVNSSRLIAAFVLSIFLLLLATGTLAQVSNEIERVSVSSAGVQGNNFSGYEDQRAGVSVSAEGRYVAFKSMASNLVPNDTNGVQDIFVHDTLLALTERVSVASLGVQSNGRSSDPAISANGRFVAFSSMATNLVAGDNNGSYDTFVYDRDTGLTELISVSSTGVQGNYASYPGSISADGRFVAFESFASNLIPNDIYGATQDVFVRDRLLGLTEIVSISSTGLQSPTYSKNAAISADGRFVAFIADAWYHVPDDTNGDTDVFVRDRLLGLTDRVSVSSTGVEANDDSDGYPSISADGRFVAFWSEASNLLPGNLCCDIYVRDRLLGLTDRVSVSSTGIQQNLVSLASPSISIDGRFVTFASIASNLVTDDTNGTGDVFVHDRQTGLTERVSVSSTGFEGNYGGGIPAISADGRFIAFASSSSNLVANDTNGYNDVFVALNILAPVVNLTQKPNLNYYNTDTPTLTWNRLSWALSYELQVDDTPIFTQPLEYSANVNILQDTTDSLSEDVHYWRVRGCSLPGVCGKWSNPERFEVDLP